MAVTLRDVVPPRFTCPFRKNTWEQLGTGRAGWPTFIKIASR